MCRAYVRSDIGLVRETNEDSYVFVPPHLFIVADGMGGHAAGEIASNLAAKTVAQHVLDNINSANPEKILEQAISHANEIIYDKAQSEPKYNGMGTTVTITYIDNNIIYWGHVGDSRIYLFRKQNNEFCQLTDDHSLVWELMRNGNISKDEAYNHPQRNMLTRAVGTSPSIKVDTGKTTWSNGDILLLCTDGLTSMVRESDICKILNSNQFSEPLIDTLVSEAKNAGGLDNITAITVQCGD